MEKKHHTLEDDLLYVGIIIPPKTVNGLSVVRHTNMELTFKNQEGETEILKVATQSDIVFNNRYHSAN